MKLSATFRYQFNEIKRTAIVFYGLFLGISLLLMLSFGVFSLVFYDNGTSTVSVSMLNGMSGVTAICVFVSGWAAFGENFRMALQHGISRKTLFAGRICAAAAGSLLYAVCDQLITLTASLIGRQQPLHMTSVPLLETIYGPQGNWLVGSLYSVIFSFFILLAVSALGHLISVLFYRLPTYGKVILVVGLFAGINLLPILLKVIRDRFHLEALWDALCRALAWFLQTAFGAAPNCMVSCLVLFALLSGFSWLVLRRMPLKK